MFTDNGNGTATISGTPTQTGPFSLVLTAENGVSPNAPQNFTLSVVRPPAITSANNTTFTAGVAGSSFTVTTSGVPTPAITVSAGLPDGVTLTDNGDGTGTLAGTPTAAGTFVVTLTAANGVSPDATQTFTLHVNASPASLAPSSVVFGTVLLNSVQFQELTLTNLATIPLQNIQVTLELGVGTQGGDYVLLNQCGSSLAASASCTIRITLNALHAGTPTATIQVSDSGAGSPRRVPVTATVLTAGATFNPPQLQFGTTKVGSTQTKSTRLTNTGTASLVISLVQITGANPGDFTQSSNCVGTLAPGVACTINVTFKPTAKISRTASLRVTTNTQSGTEIVPLSGTGK